MSQPDIDQLVQIIADRVKQRLGAPASAASGPCSADQNCDGCGQCAARRPAEIRVIRDAGAERVSSKAGVGEVSSDLAGMIDHTLLKADATAEDLRKLCEEARRYRFASVCVNSTNVARAAAHLQGTGVMVCAVVGFPLGAMAPGAKAYEAREAVRAGAQEIDMVINIGALKGRDYATVLEDIRRVVEAARPARVKVILETGALTHRGEDRRLHPVEARRRGLRQDLHRLRRRGRHRRGRRPHAAPRRQRAGRQGLGRHPHPRGRREDGRRGRHAHRRVGLGGHRHRAEVGRQGVLAAGGPASAAPPLAARRARGVAGRGSGRRRRGPESGQPRAPLALHGRSSRLAREATSGWPAPGAPS